MKEVFKDIKGYEGLYAISNKGRIWMHPKNVNGCRNGKYLKPQINYKGYLQIRLCKNHKRYSTMVHRLVALTFIGGIKNKSVHHKDKNRQNNYVSNLEIVSIKDHDREHKLGKNNPMYGVRGQLHYKAKRVKCIETGIIYESVTEAQNLTNTSSISDVCNHKRISANKMHWEFVEEN